MESPDPVARLARTRTVAVAFVVAAFAIVPIHALVFIEGLNRSRSGPLVTVFFALSALQTACGLGGLVAGVVWAVRLGRAGAPRTKAVIAALAGALAMLGGSSTHLTLPAVMSLEASVAAGSSKKRAVLRVRGGAIRAAVSARDGARGPRGAS